MKLGTVACFLAVTAGSAFAGPVALATYQFNNTTSADEAGLPAMTLVLDGTATSAYVTDTVFGQSRTVLQLNGSGGGNNAGFSFDNSLTLLPSTNYAVEMAFEFSQNPGGWRKILDVSNRTSDSGFYVDPSSNLDIYPVVGLQPWTNNVYHHVVLSVNAGTVDVYLDGATAISTATSVMDLGSLLNFFLDDTATGENEFSSSQVAFVRLYGSALTAQDAATLFNNGDPVATLTPEPVSTALMGGGLMLLGLCRKLRRKA